MREFAALRGVTQRAVRYWLNGGLPAASRNPVRLDPAVANAWADRHTTPDSPYSHGGRRGPAAEKTPSAAGSRRGHGPGGSGADTGDAVNRPLDLTERGLEAAIAAGTLAARDLDLMREALKVRKALRDDAIAQGELMRASDVERTWGDALARLRSALETIPQRASSRLQTELSLRQAMIPAVRRIIEGELLAVLATIAGMPPAGPASPTRAS